MRAAAGLFGVLFTGVLSQALAADPQPAPPAAVAPAGQQSATAPAAAPTTAPASSDSETIKPPLTVIGTKPELTPQEKELLSRGYKIEMRHGDKYFCRREQQIGSRFEVKSCDTAESIEARRVDSQEAVRVIQNDRATVNK
jgi:ribulose bisphosphate carboxylase small subunit